MNPIAATKEVLEGAQRLNRYMESVDSDLKQVASIVNNNFLWFKKELEMINSKIDRIEKHLGIGDGSNAKKE